jgi:hypothetical protein
MIADGFNNGFLALPKGDYGVALQENEIDVIYAAVPADRFMSAPQLHDKFQKLCTASRDIMIMTPSLVPASVDDSRYPHVTPPRSIQPARPSASFLP